MTPLGKEVNGSSRWMSLGSFTFQPSEFIKYLIPLFALKELQKTNFCVNDYKEFLKLVFWIGVPVLLIFLEPDNGTVLIIGVVMIALFFLVGIPMKFWLYLALAGTMVVGGALVKSPLPR